MTGTKDITILGIIVIVAIVAFVLGSFYFSDTRFSYQNKQDNSVPQLASTSSEDKDLVGGASKRCAPPPPTCKNNSENIYNVKLYQAKGDGVSDDSAAVQSAINAAAVTCGIVFFPDGDYKLNILVPTCVSLQGSVRGYVSYVGSPLAPVRLISASDGIKSAPVIGINNGVTWFSIRDIQVYGKGSGSADRGIYIPDGSHGIIERVTVMNCAEEAIRWERGLGLVLRDVKAVNCLLNTARMQHSGVVYIGGHDGIIQDSELSPSIKGLTSERMYVNALVLAGSNTWVDNVVMAFADAGLYIDAKSTNNMIRGSRIEFNFGNGAIVDGSGTFINNIAQTNSQAANNSYDGFYITGSTNVFIGNRVETALGFSNPDKFHRYAFNDKLNSATNKNVYVGNYVSDGSVGTAKFNSYDFPGEVPFSVDPVHLYAPLTLSGLLSVGTYMHTLPTNTNIWVAGAGSVTGGITQSRLSLGVDNNADYGGYIKVTDQSGNIAPVELTLGVREHAVDKDTIIFKNGEVFIPSLKSATGGGKKMVCVDTTTGLLYASSNGINCEE